MWLVESKFKFIVPCCNLLLFNAIIFLSSTISFPCATYTSDKFKKKTYLFFRYNAAKKDNDFVYHDKVPDIDSLPEVKGASLVKGIPFNTDDKEVCVLVVIPQI